MSTTKQQRETCESPHHEDPSTPSRRVGTKASRGFTLLELMAVVVMIGILVALAVPATRAALRGKRAASAARQVEMIYQLARMRAIGRGSAVMVRFNTQAPDYGFSVREAVAGIASGTNTCALTPVPSCTRNPNRWNNPQLYREINKFQPLPGGDASYENMSITFKENNGTTSVQRTVADICFTPGGLSFIRPSTAGSFQLLTGVPSILITEKNAANQIVGIQRTIFVLPNGMARLAI